jgi:hypothetical protein
MAYTIIVISSLKAPQLRKWSPSLSVQCQDGFKTNFILLGPMLRLPWCCSKMIFPVIWIPVTCLLSNFMVFLVHQKKLPWPCHMLSLLLLWTFLCLRKTPHQYHCRNKNPQIFVFNKIRESNLFWHFLISEAIRSSCQWKTIITTHTHKNNSVYIQC